MIVFSHIQRTGGTSLRRFIADRVGRHCFMDALSDFAFTSDLELMGHDFLATHCGYGIFRRLPTARRQRTSIMMTMISSTRTSDSFMMK